MAVAPSVLVLSASVDRAWASALGDALRRWRIPSVVRIVGGSAASNANVEKPPDRGPDEAATLVAVWSRAARHDPDFQAALAEYDRRRLSEPEQGATVESALVFVAIDGLGILPGYEHAKAVRLTLGGDGVPWPSPKQVPPSIWTVAMRELREVIAARPPRPRAKYGASKRPGPAPATEAGPADALSMEAALRQYPPFNTARDVLEHARMVAGVEAGAVSTSMLLAAISDRGEVEKSPTWTASWLRTRWGNDGNRRLRDMAKQDAPAVSRSSPSRPFFTPGAAAAVKRAAEIAHRTSGSQEFHVRHLLAALLTDTRGPSESSAISAFGRLSQDVERLRVSFFDFVRGSGDDDDEWGSILLGALSTPQVLPGFDADSGSADEDYLDVKPDVLAFAGLIAARTLKPPLSIGLFGEWGSGKTFFMRLLQKQVAYLSRRAREEFETNQTRQRDQAFYRRIVQIEFNAWHYAEGNLWASLVQHIFANLRVIDDRKQTVSEQLAEPLLKKLQEERSLQVQAEKERALAEKQRREASTAVDTAKKNFEQKAKELAVVSGKNVLASVPTAEMKNALQPLATVLKVDLDAGQIREFQAALNEAKATLVRGRAAIVPLLRSENRGLRWLYLAVALLAGPVVAVIVAYLLREFEQGISNLTAVASGVAAFLTAGTDWLRRQVTWVGDKLDKLEVAQRSFDKQIEDALAKNTQEIREAEERLRLLEADYVAAKEREEHANRRVLEAEAKLAAASVPAALASFIEDRANSADYRKHLGMLALVRNDFEKLSDLINEENELLNGGDQPSSLADEQANEPKRINRIVLYIDDLDRCPPAKVVEVLQAVHLLLAFPLFVVVVGVDARWVVRSLEARYRELLNTSAASADDRSVAEFRELFGNANAHDYVEKIFQVPFWLKQMTPDGSRRMVTELLKGSIAAAPAAEPVAQRADLVESHDAVRPSTAVSTPADQAAPGDNEARMVPPAGESAANEPVAPDLSSKALEITAEEVAAMSDLAPLLGRSPRTLKRFVNVYRLIRVGLSPWDRQLFLSAEHGVPDYRAVLLLLAVDTGAPLVAARFFHVMRGIVSGEIRDGESWAPTFAHLLAVLDRAAADETPEWQMELGRVARWLHERLQRAALPDDAQRFARWIPRVSRFSFHTGRG